MELITTDKEKARASINNTWTILDTNKRVSFTPSPAWEISLWKVFCMIPNDCELINFKP